MLIIGDKSISILRLLQSKDPKREIFAHEVKHLVNLINKNKEVIERMRCINDMSVEGQSLMRIMFSEFYNDLEFIKDMEQRSRLYVASIAQKQVKARLFNKKTTAILINILDEPGKINKISKNLPAVLGYSPDDLLGKSINEIIPFSIQPFHDEILLKFMETYSKKNHEKRSK
jgi:transcriptional regulator with PAS, ATPase and Fis domain